MVQKVLKIGSSIGVTIPKKSLKELGLKAGDSVRVEVDRTTRSVRITPAINVDAELVEWTDSFIDEYRPALEELAKK